MNEPVDWTEAYEELNKICACLEQDNTILRDALEYMASEGCTMEEPCVVSNDREDICFSCYAKQTLQRAEGDK